VLKHTYRMRTTMMVHSYGLWARMIGQGAAHTEGHPLKDDRPFTEDEIRTMLEEGIAGNAPVDRGFEPVVFTSDLVPAAGPLKLPSARPGVYPNVPQDRQTYLIWVERAPAEVHLKVTTQRVWALRPHRVSLHWTGAASSEAVDTSDVVRPDGKQYDVVLKTPQRGLHRVEIRDGGDYTRIVWPEGMPVVLPSGADTPGVTNHFRGGWTLYFYVPKGTKVVGGWASRIANWAPRISGTLRDAEGNAVYDFGKVEGGWFSVPVPKGHDGRLWKFQDSQGTRLLMTVPPYFARSSRDLLLPAEVVEADAR